MIAAGTVWVQDPPVGRPPDSLGGVLDFLGRMFQSLLALPEQASGFAVRVDWLQIGQFVGFWALGLVLLGFTGYFLVRYRRPSDLRGPVRTPRVTAPVWLELGVAGVLLVFFVAAWAVGFRQYASADAASADDFEIYVIGKQWMWEFEYPNGRKTVGELYLPRGRRVRLLVTSRDVIHSFFVPEFRIKRDAVPGRYNSVSFTPTRTGTRRVLCTEYCGTAHSRMWAEAVVLEPEAFGRWLSTGRAPDPTGGVSEPRPLEPGDSVPPERASLAQRGRREAGRLGCLGCHTVDGTIHLAPTWRNLFGRREVLESGDTVVVGAGYITESMMRPQEQIVRGFEPLMPSYQGQVDPSQTAAIIEYIRALSTDPAPEGSGRP